LGVIDVWVYHKEMLEGREGVGSMCVHAPNHIPSLSPHTLIHHTLHSLSLLLTNTHTAPQNHTQEFAALYRKLGKSDALHAEYARARPAALHRLWFAFHPTQVYRVDSEQ
jgi:hypothetical protein